MAPPDFSRFGPALRRIRAAEQPDAQGGKRVWHQASPEVDVISFVDAAGRVSRQECHLGPVTVVWRAGAPVSTGTTVENRQSGGRASDSMIADATASPTSVLLALGLLQAVPPGDRYLDHLCAALEAAAEGLDAGDESQVTSMRVPEPAAAGAQRRSLLLPAMVGLAAAVAAGLWLWHRM